MTIAQLEYLDAVLRSPTWAEAADTVGVSPSALSQGIAELERRVGVALFDRDGRRRVLRDQAIPIAEYASQVLASTSDIARYAAGLASGTFGTLRVGMIDAAAVDHFAEAVRGFRDDRPDVELRLTVGPSGMLLDQLGRGDLDLAVCVHSPAAASHDTVHLLREPLAVYGPTSRPLPPRRWGPWVSFPTGSHTREIIADALAGAGARFDVVAESHQPDVLAAMVRLGLGWAVLPTVQAERGAEPLVPARRRPIAHRDLVVVRRSRRAPHPGADALVQALRAGAGAR